MNTLPKRPPATSRFSRLHLIWLRRWYFPMLTCAGPIAHGAYFSLGKIGMSNLGRSDINAQMEGVMEVRRTDVGDEFSLYLELSPDVWYFMDYAQNQLGIVSSDVNFNDQVLAKGKNAKTRNMALIALGFEEKALFLDRFSDFYQPALKKAMPAKAAAAKKEAKKKVEKKKAEAAEGF